MGSKKFLFAFLISSSYAGAAEYFVWGGGADPTSSQVVLERNLNLFHEIADAKAVPLSSRKTLFGSGPNNPNDVDVVLKERDLENEEKVLSTMLRSYPPLGHTFRKNKVNNLNAGASKQEVAQELSTFLGSLGANKKARLYFTGHGAGENPYRKNFFVSWGRETFTVNEFTEILDKSESNESLQLIMTQCYSGGFSQINYEEGKLGGNLSDKNRCGFYSQIPSRVAAGCSADILEREEYTPYFMAAVSGRHESGYSVNADYNRDGVVGANEAHYFVFAKENSLDIPVTTSTEFLRNEIQNANVEISQEELLSSLSAEEKFAFNTLLEATGINSTSENLEADIKEKLKAEQAQLADIHITLKTTQRSFGQSQRPLLRALQAANGNPSVEEYKELMLLQESYPAAEAAYLEIIKVSKAEHAKVVAIAKLERLEYLIASKKLEKTLRESGSNEQKSKYSQLKNCEAESFL